MITLSDSTGAVVSQGVLSGCRWVDWRFFSGIPTAKPEFSFTMTGVVEVPTYIPRVGGKTLPAVALSGLRNAGWNLDLVVT
jgi:hypothetical protein